MDDLITANLWSRPTRTIISVFAVALGVILMLVLGGLATGTLDDTINRTMSLGADFILQPSDTGMLFALGSPSLPAGIVRKLADTKGVGAVTPVLSKFSMSDVGIIFGIDFSSYDQFPGTIQIVEGKRSLEDEEVIVDQLFAKSRNIRPGMRLSVLGHPFTVSGICRAGSVVREYVSLRTLGRIMETDKISMIFIKASPGTDLKQLEKDLKGTYDGYHLTTANDASMLLEATKIPLLKEFRYAIVFIAAVISFMVVLLAMYTTIFERTREIGILKSLGASRIFIVSMILRESVMISCLGAILGTGISEVIRKVIISSFPTLQVTISAGSIGRGCLVGLLGGVLGALYPAYKAAQMDPVRALSYE